VFIVDFDGLITLPGMGVFMGSLWVQAFPPKSFLATPLLPDCVGYYESQLPTCNSDV